MKKRILVIVVLFFVLNISYSQSDSNEYLVLSIDQLRDIGFVINNHGIFFVCKGPASEEWKVAFTTYGYYNNKYGSGMLNTFSKYNDIDTTIINPQDTMFTWNIHSLKVDYHLIKIINVKGRIYEEGIYKSAYAVPFLIKQSQFNFHDKDDLIVYLKYTKSLKNKLSYIPNLKKYVTKVTFGQ